MCPEKNPITSGQTACGNNECRFELYQAFRLNGKGEFEPVCSLKCPKHPNHPPFDAENASYEGKNPTELGC